MDYTPNDLINILAECGIPAILQDGTIRTHSTTTQPIRTGAREGTLITHTGGGRSFMPFEVVEMVAYILAAENALPDHVPAVKPRRLMWRSVVSALAAVVAGVVGLVLR